MAKKKLVRRRALAVLMSVSLSTSLTGISTLAAEDTSAKPNGVSSETDSPAAGEAEVSPAADTPIEETEKKDYKENITTATGTDENGNKTETTTKEETWTETREDGEGGTQDVDVKQTTTTTTVVEENKETVTKDPVEETLEILPDQALEKTDGLKTEIITDLPSGELSVTLKPDENGKANGKDHATPEYEIPEETEHTQTKSTTRKRIRRLSLQLIQKRKIRKTNPLKRKAP